MNADLSPVLNAVGSALSFAYTYMITEKSCITVTDQIDKLFINCGLTMWAFICGLTGGLLADSTGRRKLFLVSTAGMLLAFVLQTICSAEFAVHKTKGIGTVVVVWICAYRIFCSYYL